MSSSLYLWLNVLTLAAPLARSFEPRVSFRSRWFALLPAIAGVGALFIAWDVYFTSIGVWAFNARYLVGWSAFGLPVEEWLFFVTVPYACVFSYDCLNYFFPVHGRPRWARFAALSLAGVSACAAVAFSDRLYTVAACASSAICMLAAGLRNPTYLVGFMRAYAACLVPFFVVNGILTGGLTDEPIVSYDDRHNTGLRLFTIPVEDAFYLLSLLWLNVSLYEFGLRRRRRSGTSRSRPTP